MSDEKENYLENNTLLFSKQFAQSIDDMMGISFDVDDTVYEQRPFEPRHNMIASIHFAGAIQGDYFVSVEEKVAASIIEAYEEGMDYEELKEMREDYGGFIKECLNLSVGESIPALEKSFGDLTFSPPMLVYGELELPNVVAGSIDISSDLGSIQCGFVLNLANIRIGQKLEESLAELELATKEANAGKQNIKSMLKVLPDALITLDSDCKILPGYSEATNRILEVEGNIKGIDLSELVNFNEDVNGKVLRWVKTVFERYNDIPFNELLKLAPIKEYTNLQNKTFKFDWYPVESPEGNNITMLMVAIQNITRELELAVKTEQLGFKHNENLKLISDIINLDVDEVAGFIYDTSQFISDTSESSAFMNLDNIDDSNLYLERLMSVQGKLGNKEEDIKEKATRDLPSVMVPIQEIYNLENRVSKYCEETKILENDESSLKKLIYLIRSLRMVKVSSLKTTLNSMISNRASLLNKKCRYIIRNDELIDIHKMRLVQHVIFQCTNWLLDYSIETTETRMNSGKIEEALFIIDVVNIDNKAIISLEADGIPIDLSSIENQFFIDYNNYEVEGFKISPSIDSSKLKDLESGIINIVDDLDTKLSGEIVIVSTNSVSGVNIIFDN